MDGALALLLVLSVFAAVCAGLVLLARRIRSRNLHGGLMSVAEELYLPSAKRLRGETQEVRQAEQKSGEKP
ncbi:hypothetical protein [Dactylosporangium sp. NPDC051541]|uniref:hypothetical protein n=1 Tax=Dactylosporangium sp. NPDC051541 TaxID=3363977 RepID=UPI00378D3F8A